MHQKATRILAAAILALMLGGCALDSETDDDATDTETSAEAATAARSLSFANSKAYRFDGSGSAGHVEPDYGSLTLSVPTDSWISNESNWIRGAIKSGTFSHSGSNGVATLRMKLDWQAKFEVHVNACCQAFATVSLAVYLYRVGDSEPIWRGGIVDKARQLTVVAPSPYPEDKGDPSPSGSVDRSFTIRDARIRHGERYYVQVRAYAKSATVGNASANAWGEVTSIGGSVR